MKVTFPCNIPTMPWLGSCAVLDSGSKETVRNLRTVDGEDMSDLQNRKKRRMRVDVSSLLEDAGVMPPCVAHIHIIVCCYVFVRFVFFFSFVPFELGHTPSFFIISFLSDILSFFFCQPPPLPHSSLYPPFSLLLHLLPFPIFACATFNCSDMPCGKLCLRVLQQPLLVMAVIPDAKGGG